MRAVGVTKPSCLDVRVEDGEVRGVEYTVANPHDGSERKQPEKAGDHPGQQDAACKQREPRQQHGAGTEAIDGEPGAELADAARDIEHADQRPERGEAHVEFRAQQRKQRRQDQLEKVRERVGDADDADDLDVFAERGCG